MSANATRIGAIRYKAMMLRPYFSTALFAMHLVESDQAVSRSTDPRTGEVTQVPTMMTDAFARVYIHPKVLDQWTIEQSAWVLIHELGHWLRKHHRRAHPYLLRARDPEELLQIKMLTNIFQDAELNDDLVAEGAKLPEPNVTPSKLGLPDGKLWEEYYDMMVEPPPVECRDCGSVAHGVPGDHELPAPGDREAPGISDGAEADLIRRQVAADIQREMKNRGDVPAGWRRWADSVLAPPVVPWERELSALVKNALVMARGAVDYSYAKPSRRYSHSPIIQPSMVRPCPEAAIVLDTSGSMQKPELMAALREIQGILRVVGQRRVPVFCCDAAVHGGAQRVSKALDVQILGGGGTDMGVGIAEAERIRASVIVVLTDGYTPWPIVPPRAQLVVGIIGASGVPVGFPPPGYARRVLHITDKKEAAA